MKYKFILFFKLLIILSIATISGCSSESGPVSLPTPFSGSLTLETLPFVSKGFPIHLGSRSGHSSGDEWLLFDDKDNCVGKISYAAIEGDLNNPGKTDFSADVTFQFDRTLCPAGTPVSPETSSINGSSFTVEGMEFIDFPYTEAAPTFAPADVTNEPGAQVVFRKGVGSGFIRKATGAFIPFINRQVNHRYLYQSIRFADGTIGFQKHEECLWYAEGPETLQRKLTTVLTESGSDIVTTPDGSTAFFELNCTGPEGQVLCGFEKDSDLEVFTFTPEKIEFGITVQVCYCDPNTRSDCPTDFESILQIQDNCVETTHSLFVDDGIPEIGPNLDLGPEEIAFAVTMTEHDPFDCSRVVGPWNPVCEAGDLALDYRCLLVFNVNTGELLRVVMGSYKISDLSQLN